MKTIIFDLGGVLIDYDHQQTLNALAEVSQVDASVFRHEVMPKMDWAIGVGEIDVHEFHRRLIDMAGTTSDFDQFLMAFGAGMARNDLAFAYAASLQNDSGIPVGIISNTSAAHVLWLDQNVPELAEFELVMMSNEVHLLKPDPEIYQLALQILDVAPHDAFFVDDLEENVVAAQALGMAGIVHTDWGITRPTIDQWLGL